MDRRNVLVIGTSAAETLRLQKAVLRAGRLDDSLCLTWEQFAASSPDWQFWDLVCVQYQEGAGRFLALMAPVLRSAKPPVLIVIDHFTPILVNHLFRLGAARVLWSQTLEKDLITCLPDLFKAGGPQTNEATFYELVEVQADYSEDRAHKQQAESERNIETSDQPALASVKAALKAEKTQRRVTEKNFHQLQEILWEIPAFIVICDVEGRFNYLNRVGRSWFGLGDQDGVEHLDVFKVYPPELHERLITEIYPQLLETGVWRGEMRMLLPDRRKIPVLQTILLHQGEEESDSAYIAAICHDISDYKAVVLELQQSRERYRALSEAARDLIFRMGLDGRVEYANHFACETLGIDLDQVEGLAASMFFPHDLAATLLQMVEDVREINSAVYSEGPVILGGEQHWLGTWLMPITDDEDQLISLLGISRDITEQKRADEALKQALENQKLLNEMRTNFFLMTSHQFRTPLNTIMLSTEMLRKSDKSWDDQQRSEQLDHIRAASVRLQKMLDDILMIGRVDSGSYKPNPTSFDLVTYCQRIMQLMATNDQGAHTMVYEPAMDQLTVFTDPDLVERAVDNLLSNALKYSGAGTTVRMKLFQEGEFCYLEVQDEGIGIPEKDIKYLFQPFRRASNVTGLPGTGIGLAIVQKSIALINGDIFVKSVEGQGTNFVVRFPIRFELLGEKI